MIRYESQLLNAPVCLQVSKFIYMIFLLFSFLIIHEKKLQALYLMIQHRCWHVLFTNKILLIVLQPQLTQNNILGEH